MLKNFDSPVNRTRGRKEIQGIQVARKYLSFLFLFLPYSNLHEKFLNKIYDSLFSSSLNRREQDSQSSSYEQAALQKLSYQSCIRTLCIVPETFLSNQRVFKSTLKTYINLDELELCHLLKSDKQMPIIPQLMRERHSQI